MKKKLFLVSLISMMLIAGLFTFSGCGKNEKKDEKEANKEATKNGSTSIVVKDDSERGLTATFDNSNNSFKEDKDLEGVTVATVVENEKLGLEATMYITEATKADIDEMKNTLIAEYLWNNYNVFTYDDNAGQIKFIVILEDNEESCIVLKGNMTTLELTSEPADLREVFEIEEIQTFFSSIKYSK